jgi:glyoxylase-like metal-dependent hydrolase (beta-lactamase superfamily II)
LDEETFATPPPAPRAAELAIEEVGREIYRLPLAIPFEVGPVNCYLVRRDEPALVDCGPRTPEAWDALAAHLAALGLAPKDLRHIVATHSHIDHHGNLARLAREAPGAWLYAHEDDAHLIFEFEESMEARTATTRALFLSWGFPEHTLDFVQKMYLSFKRYAESVPRARLRPIRGEDAAVALGPLALRALHMPGHTEGLVCLLLEEAGGILFANDHVLERITPNPTVYMPPYRGRRTGLADYLESLRRLRGIEAARVLPGHGRPFGGLARRIDEIMAHHERRAGRVEELLPADAGKTVIELALELWPALPPAEYYLACREMNGHLELLEAAGRARCELEGVVGRWRRA